VGRPPRHRLDRADTEDLALWDAMDKAATDVAAIFAAGGTMEIIQGGPGPVRDGLGTTHHEAGTLWMGDQGPTRSPTNADCQLNQLTNAYVAAPALLPSTGSPNPMLTGIALARRLGDRLATPPTPFHPADGFTPLFDGFSLANWRMSTIRNQPGRDNPGHFSSSTARWNRSPEPISASSGARRRFRRTTSCGLIGCAGKITTIPGCSSVSQPESKGYNNNAFVAVDFGSRCRSTNSARRTGRTSTRPAPSTATTAAATARHSRKKPARPVGQWNEYEIRVKGQNYQVFLNGDQVCVFDNPYPGRGLPSTAAAPTYIGLQTHTGGWHSETSGI